MSVVQSLVKMAANVLMALILILVNARQGTVENIVNRVCIEAIFIKMPTGEEAMFCVVFS